MHSSMSLLRTKDESFGLDEHAISRVVEATIVDDAIGEGAIEAAKCFDACAKARQLLI